MSQSKVINVRDLLNERCDTIAGSLYSNYNIGEKSREAGGQEDELLNLSPTAPIEEDVKF